jgi:hypothetical protein
VLRLTITVVWATCLASAEYVKKYATEEALEAKSESDMSEDISSYSDISDGEEDEGVFP